MLTKRFTASVLVLMVLFLFAGGCSKCCYKVTDTCTNAVYYTHKVERTPCGTLEFRDARTAGAWSFGDKHEIQAARIERVPKCQCRSQDITEPACPEKMPCKEKKAPCEGKTPCPGV